MATCGCLRGEGLRVEITSHSFANSSVLSHTCLGNGHATRGKHAPASVGFERGGGTWLLHIPLAIAVIYFTRGLRLLAAAVALFELWVGSLSALITALSIATPGVEVDAGP